MKKLSKVLSMMIISTMALVGCQQEQPKEETKQTQEIVVKDREGNDVVMPESMDKIISTAPSNTEVLLELGLGDNLVAVDKYSTDIEGLPTGLEVLDFSSPDAEAIIALDPDAIIASGHNKTGSTEDPFALVSEAGIPVFYIPTSESIQGIYDDIAFMADITDTQAEGEKLVGDMKKEIAKIEEIGKTITDKKSVYFEIAPAPGLYSFGQGTFLNEMIELIGATNILASETAWISPSEEAILDANPDVILTNVSYVENPLDEIKARVGWDNTEAVKNDDVYSISTNPSARASHNIIIALKEMSEAIYPEYYGQE